MECEIQKSNIQMKDNEIAHTNLKDSTINTNEKRLDDFKFK